MATSDYKCTTELQMLKRLLTAMYNAESTVYTVIGLFNTNHYILRQHLQYKQVLYMA